MTDAIDDLYQTFVANSKTPYRPLPFEPAMTVRDRHPLLDAIYTASEAIWDHLESHPEPETEAALTLLYNELCTVESALEARAEARTVGGKRVSK